MSEKEQEQAEPPKPNTKFRACKLGCGVRFWCERPGTCPGCKAALAKIAADQRIARKVANQVQPSRSKVGSAYTRGRQMSSVMRTYGR